MTTIQFIGSLLLFLFGWVIFAGADSAIHQSVALSFVIGAAVLFSGGAITYTINKLTSKLDRLPVAAPSPPASQPTPQAAAEPVVPQPEPERRTPPPPRSWVDDAREQLQKEKGAAS